MVAQIMSISVVFRGPLTLQPSLRFSQAVTRRTGNMVANEPSFFDKILFGTRGRPENKTPEPDGPISLAAFFAQLDADGNGSLDRVELKRALMLVGLRKVDFDASFEALDADGDGLVTFEEFDAALPDSTRTAIEQRINEDGVLDSLYLPPEQWSEERSKAEIQWEQMVQMQAQRSGNALRQNDILNNELGKM